MSDVLASDRSAVSPNISVLFRGSRSTQPGALLQVLPHSDQPERRLSCTPEPTLEGPVWDAAVRAYPRVGQIVRDQWRRKDGDLFEQASIKQH